MNRVERILGRAAKDWLAPDIARVIAMGKAISDGMATLEETFPPIPAAAVEKPTTASTSPGAASSAPAGESEPKAETKTEQDKPAAEPKPKSGPKNSADYLVLAATTAHEATDIDTLRAWYAGDEQRKLRTLLHMSAEDVNQARKIIEERVIELRKGQ